MRKARKHWEAWPEKQEMVLLPPTNWFVWVTFAHLDNFSSHYYLVHIIKIQATHVCF